MADTKSNSLVTRRAGNSNSLVPSNVRVRMLSRQFRWGVDTLIRRVENSITSPVEQDLYLRVARGYRLHPESFLVLLEIFRGNQELHPTDMQRFNVGKNLFKCRFDDVLDKVEQALLFIDKTRDMAECNIKMEHAAWMVEHYGDHAEMVMTDIIDNSSEVAELLGMKLSTPVRIVVSVAIKTLIKKLNKERNGATMPLTIEEMFGDVRQKERRIS